MNYRLISAVATLGLLSACGGVADGSASPIDETAATAEALHGTRDGAVFTQTNEAGGNRVLAYARQRDGLLTGPVAYATEGTGSGDSLGSQAALRISGDERWLFVVNAGSNDVSSFSVRGPELTLRDRVASGGEHPISVAESHGIVYVLNAGAAGNIAGFRVDNRGHLAAIPGAIVPLSGSNVGPAQIEFAPNGRELVVTEKTTNRIDVYRLDEGGRAAGPEVHDSAGQTPFGFDFTRTGTLVVSEAATESTSSYSLREPQGFRVISNAVPDTQAAPCWVALSRDDRFAFVANAGSSSISSYAVGRFGALQLVDARAGDAGPGSRPLDMALDDSGRALYLVDRGNAVVSVFGIQNDGRLQNLQMIGTLPPFTSGVAAY